jgi:hypothetical protein
MRRWMIAVGVTAVVTKQLVWVVRFSADAIARQWLTESLLAPCLAGLLLGMAALALLSPWLTRRLLYLTAGGACVVALIIAVTPLVEGDPLRYKGAFSLVGTLCLGLTCLLGHFVSIMRSKQTD